MAAYVLEGPRWGTGAAGTSGGTLTWALDGTVPSAFLGDIQTAFADWAAHANLTFQQVASTAAANIRFSDSAIDGLDNTLGVTNYGYSGKTFTSAAITFDSGEGWHASGSHVVSTDGVNLFLVALHEIGHALGLDHYNAAPAVMNAVLNPTVTDLTASDIGGIQALYGAPAAPATATASAATTVATTVATPTVAPASTTSASADHLNGVYRFFDTHTGDHFYTTSAGEAQQIKASIPFYTYEGVSWATPDKGTGTGTGTGAEDVFRFFDTKSGTHFYTADTGERDQIIAGNGTYHYEGVAFEAYTTNTGAAGLETLERFFNTATGQHHMAGDPTEIASLKAGQQGPAWVDEGATFTVHSTDGLVFA